MDIFSSYLFEIILIVMRNLYLFYNEDYFYFYVITTYLLLPGSSRVHLKIFFKSIKTNNFLFINIVYKKIKILSLKKSDFVSHLQLKKSII